MKESNEKENEQTKEEKIYKLDEYQKEKLDQIIKENKYFYWYNLGVYGTKDLILFLKSCKDYIFNNEEYKNEIMNGNLNFILNITKGIERFYPQPEPETYFILLKEVFNLYQSGLEQKYIISFTNAICELISNLRFNKDKVVLSNFNILFDILIYLKVNLISQNELKKKPFNSLNTLLKESLKSNEIKNNIFINKFFEIINIKLQSQQYVILSLLVDYLQTISSIEIDEKNKLNLYHGMLKPVLQLQMDKNTYIDCEDVIKQIEKNFSSYYKENQKLMDDIFEISIEECCQKNNKINENALELLDIFFKNWPNKKSTSPQNENQKKMRPFSESKNPSKKRGSAYKSKENNIANLKPIQININKNINIPFNLFPKVISLIIKSCEYTTKFDKIENLIKNMLDLIKNWEKFDIFDKDVIDKVLSGMGNKKIFKKKRLIFLLDFIFDIFNENSEYEEFKEFCINYIKSIPIDDIDDFILFEQLLLEKCFMNINKNSLEFIFEKLVYKIINSKDLINKGLIYKSSKSISDSINDYVNKRFLDKNYELIDFFEIIAKVFTKIFNQDDISKGKKDDNISQINIINFEEKIVCALTDLLLEKNIINNYKNLSKFKNYFLIKEEKEREKFFSNLYSIWSINPISVLILCIVTENFELAYNIILNLKDVKFNDDIFKKLGKLVETFKNEKYDCFWQKLLEPSENIYFIKTLFGILMILPQGVAFDYLSDKLSNVQTLLKIEEDDKKSYTKLKKNKKKIESQIEFFLKRQEDKNPKKI